MAIIFKPERMTETDRLASTRKPEDGELIVASSGTAIGNTRCNIYIGNGTTQLKSLKPAIVGVAPLKWVKSDNIDYPDTKHTPPINSVEVTYWDSDTSNYYLRMVVIYVHYGLTTAQNIVQTIVIPNPQGTYNVAESTNRTYRAGYFQESNTGGMVGFNTVLDSTNKKITISQNSTFTFVNGSTNNIKITWCVHALYQYEK